MDIKPQTDLFFFDSFGADGLKSFIIQDDQKVTEKIPLGTEQLTRTDNKIRLVNIKFYLNSCKNLSKMSLIIEIVRSGTSFILFSLLEISLDSVIL